MSDRDEISQALAYADEYFERSMVGKSIQGGDHIQTLAAAYRAQAEQLRELREAVKGFTATTSVFQQRRVSRDAFTRMSVAAHWPDDPRAALSRTEADG